MNILLGLTGSVATIVAERVVEALKKLGNVRVVSTPKAEYFLSHVPPIGADLIGEEKEWPPQFKKGDPVLHIELRKWADVMVIAPASAHSLAQLSLGLSDNLLTSTARAWDFGKPILVAPAMNTFMWEHPVTSTHLDILRSWGYGVVEPVSKMLACGDEGMGAMASAETIAAAVCRATTWLFPMRPSDCDSIPTGAHPGAFAFRTENTINSGVDLYCREGAPFYAVEDGMVVRVEPFAWPADKTRSWKNCEAVLVENAHHCVIYGPCQPLVYEKQTVRAGDLLGHVVPALDVVESGRDIPGESASMLHLELMSRGHRTWLKWSLGQAKPCCLHDPTPWLLRAVKKPQMID